MDDDRADAGGSPDQGEPRTDAWFWARMELGLGIGLVVLAGFTLVAAPTFVSTPTFTLEGPGYESPLVIAGCVGMVVGLVWMIRIFRGSHDEPPPWRYRDR
jgi:hypothetical protein